MTKAFAQTSTPASNGADPKDVVQAGLKAAFIDFDVTAVETIFSEDYIQHNPAIPTGRLPLVQFLPTMKETGLEITTHRLLSEGNIVVSHNTYSNAAVFGAEAVVAFDVFRIDGGVIVEHWDNITPLAAPNPSNHTQVDGPTKVIDQDKTSANKALVENFVNTILVGGKLDKIADFFDGDVYVQHNSQIADGLSGLGAAIKAMGEQGVTMRYTHIHKIVAEGNFVFVMSEGLFGSKATAFFDLFRVEGGKIIEHWDVISDIPEEMAHTNGKF